MSVRVPMTRPIPAAALAAGGLLLVMAWAQYGIRTDAMEPLATAVLVLAALATAVLVGRLQPASAVQDDLPALQVHGPDAALVGIGAAALAAAAVLLTVRWRRFFVLGVFLLFGGVVLLSVGLWRAQPRAAPAAGRWTWGEAGALLGVVAVALWMRFVAVHEFPPAYGIFAIEEPQTGMGGAIILDGYRPWEFLVDHYLAALALRVGGPSLPALRVPFTLFSAFTVVPLYLLLRQLVRPSAACFGSFLLAISSWHLAYARCAHNIFLGTFLVVCVWGLLVHAERTHRLAVYPWVGLLAGSTLFGYAGYRGTVGFVLLFLALAMLRHWYLNRRANADRGATHWELLRRDLAGTALSVTVVAAMVPPLVARVYTDPHPNYSYFEAAHRSLANREYYTSDTDRFLAQRLERLRAAAAIFLHYGDESPSFNLPGRPMLDPVTGTLFVAGLLYAACFPWRRHNGYFVAVGVVLFIGGAVFVQNLDVRRLQGLVPLVCLFVALFVDAAFGTADRLGRWGAPVFVALIVAGGAGAFVWNAHAFRTWATDPEVRRSFHNEYLALVRLGREEARGRYLVVVSDLSTFFGENDYKWLIRGSIAGETVTDVLSILPPQATPGAGQPVSVVLLPPYDEPGVADHLRRDYPGTRCRLDVTPDAPDLRMTVCDLAAHAPSAVASTLTATYSLGDDGPPVLVRPEPFIAFATVPDVCRSRAHESEVARCRVEWQGTFTLPSAAYVRFAAEARDGSLAITIDGQRVRGHARLPAGMHAFTASATYARGPGSGAQLRWRVGAGPPVLMPFYSPSSES